MQRQAQGHDVGIVLTEFQGRSILGQGVQVHAEKIHREFTVDVMELVFVLAVIFLQVFFIHLFEIVEIVRAMGIDALVNDKVLPVFFGNEGIAAVGAAQFHGREAALSRRKPGSADLAEELAFGAVIPVKEWLWGVTTWTGAVLRDITFRAAADRTYFLTIALFVVRDEILVRPALTKICDEGKFVNFELLVLWRMGIVKGPLLKWNISADKVN